MLYFTEKQGDGRFNAMVKNETAPHYPRRVGFIIGGRDSWLAESGPESLGYHKSRKAALAAIASHKESGK